MGLLGWLFGKGDEDNLPDILSETEEGFADLVFRITTTDWTRDRWRRFVAKGTFRGQKVGLAVEVSPVWKPGTLGEGIIVHTGALRYVSLGAESDALLAAWREVYGAAPAPAGMAEVTLFDAMSLEGDPARLDLAPAKIKLFSQSGSESEYAEVFTNIDVRARKVEIREKDGGYRPALLAAMTRK